MRFEGGWLRPVRITAASLAFLVIACDQEEEPAQLDVGPVKTSVSYPSGTYPHVVVTPPEAPDNVAVVQIEITDGVLSASGLTLQDGEPVVLYLDNHDSHGYQLRVTEDIVVEDIPAATLTRAQIVMPETGEFEAHLFTVNDDLTDSLQVIVE